MPFKTPSGRHRSAQQVTPMAALSQAVTTHAGVFGRQAAVVAAASGLVAGVTLPAVAADQAPPQLGDSIVTVSATKAVSTTELSAQVTAQTDAPIDFQHVTAASKPAPAERAADQVSAQSQNAGQVPQKAAPQQGKQAVQSAVPAGTGGLAAVVAAAYQGVGKPYVWGGTTPNGWDCSGFIGWAYAQAGIKLPRINQWTVMVPTSTPKPGDLVVQNGGSHVAIYVGNGMEIGALNPVQGTLLTTVDGVGSATYYTMP